MGSDSIVERLRNMELGPCDEAAEMLEFFLAQMQLTDCKMDGKHGWRFRHGWPMTHCIGSSAEEAAKAAIQEVKRSRIES